MHIIGIHTKNNLLISIASVIASISIGWWHIDNRYKKTTTLVEQNKRSEKEKIHERINTAIEKLGDKNDLKLMATFDEFYRIAKIEPNAQKNIFDILCAHLRQTTKHEDYKNNLKPTDKVQSLLDFLFKPKNTNILIFSDLDANLAEANLQGANLQEANLQGANLQEANLQEANLQEANLQRVNLQRANLRYANLQGVDMQEAYLREADLLGAEINEKTTVITPDNWKNVVKQYENEDGEKRPFVVVINGEGNIKGRY